VVLRFFTKEVATAMDRVARLPTLADLKHHVLCQLCKPDELDPNQTPLLQALITRRGLPCGLFFQAQGPRLLKTYAIWAGNENRILFYDCSGYRVAETRLSEGPDPGSLVDEPAMLVLPEPNISRAA
jgi:hypothetical protein